MYATAVVGGKVDRFKLSSALARAHRRNRVKAMTEAKAVAFVEVEASRSSIQATRTGATARQALPCESSLTPAF